MAICFYWADKGIGGVPVEYSILINNISRDVHVKLFTVENSFLLNHIKDKTLVDIYMIDEVVSKELSNLIDIEDVLVITTFHEFIYRYNINCRILFWNVFPTTITSINKILLFNKKSCQKMLNIMLEKSGLVFMDNTGVDNATNNRVCITQEIKYFPVIVEEIAHKHVPSFLGDILRIVYVGRAIIWKVYPVLKMIKDIEQTEYADKIQITIITDDEIKFSHLLNYNSILQIKFIADLSQKELNSFLLHNCDLYIGMGTSCLDAAKIGLPSILADYSYQPFSGNYMYTWLYNTKCYCLGNLAEEKQISYKDFFLQELLTDIFANNSKLLEHSERSYLYVKAKHSIENFKNIFIGYCQNTQLMTADFQNNIPLRRKKWWLIFKGLKRKLANRLSI